MLGTLKTFCTRRISDYDARRSRAIPYVELHERHIRNLRVVLDRKALLETLPKQSVAAEIGVDHGDFSAQILAHAAPRHLHLIDSWGSARYHEGLVNHVQQRFQPEIAAGQVRINRGISTEVLETFDDHTFDWVYVDTNHSYQTTAAELELCRRKVKPHGVIAGHDYVTGNWRGWVRYGVVEAVNEFCVRHDWEIIHLTHETHRHLSFALRPIAP